MSFNLPDPKQLHPGLKSARIESEVSLEERTRARLKAVHKVITQLQKPEDKYRFARRKSHNGKGNKDLNRDAVFACLQRIDFTENQINRMIDSVEDVLRRMRTGTACYGGSCTQA